LINISSFFISLVSFRALKNLFLISSLNIFQ
jgi:hypothetical protein